MLNASQLRELSTAGIDVGSHTSHHVALAGLDADTRRRELVDSRARLEDLLGQSVPHFAYPYGSFDRAARDAVEAAGYLAGCSRKPGRNRSGEDVFMLRRIGIGGHDELPAFRWKVRFGLEDVEPRLLARACAKRVLTKLGVRR
jgi:peptidoglycan/xylan/chitin deacetylase (PgdA/CDA1 family)